MFAAQSYDEFIILNFLRYCFLQIIEHSFASSFAKYERWQSRNPLLEAKLAKEFVIEEFDIMRSFYYSRRAFRSPAAIADSLLIRRRNNYDFARIVI